MVMVATELRTLISKMDGTGKEGIIMSCIYNKKDICKNCVDNEESTENESITVLQRVFTEDEFTKDELMLLRLAFKLVDDVVELQRSDRYDTFLPNELYSLKEKLGISDLVQD